jgi:L-ascorbate metabolism protein UlaG (beta-lactamase superfamily)
MLLGFTRPERRLPTNESTSRKVLRVQWLGTAAYMIQFGDQAILTDPFFTHQSLSRIWLGGTIKSNPTLVSNALANLPIPQAIFVSHSHYDHLLDAAQCLKHPGWGAVPIHASPSTRNLLAGYGPEFTNSWRATVTGGAWQPIAPGIRYKAILARHGRQVPLLPLLYSGCLTEPRGTPPRRASHFKVGDSYAFIFEFSDEQSTNTVYFVGAAHGREDGFPDPTVENVDIAILCVPTWKLSRGYPRNIIGRTRPKHIVASHYDNFFQTNGKPVEVVPLADMDGFLREVQRCASYPRFKSILVPSVGSVLQFTHE